jgi:hypothetical protein
MEIQMSGTHQTTYNAVFQHPIAHNLQWHDVRSMLSALADLTEEHNGNLKFTRHDKTLIIHPPQHKDFSDVKELMKIRHFLEHSNVTPQEPTADGMHLLVVIDHREARIYKTKLSGSVPERITPYDPDGIHRHLHNVDEEANGQLQPEIKSFYDAIVRSLNGSEEILIFGSSTGSSSAMDYLMGELKQKHPELAKRVVGTVVVNEQHMTENQLLAQARSFYAAKHS